MGIRDEITKHEENVLDVLREMGFATPRELAEESNVDVRIVERILVKHYIEPRMIDGLLPGVYTIAYGGVDDQGDPRAYRVHDVGP